MTKARHRPRHPPDGVSGRCGAVRPAGQRAPAPASSVVCAQHAAAPAGFAAGRTLHHTHTRTHANAHAHTTIQTHTELSMCLCARARVAYIARGRTVSAAGWNCGAVAEPHTRPDGSSSGASRRYPQCWPAAESIKTRSGGTSPCGRGGLRLQQARAVRPNPARMWRGGRFRRASRRMSDPR
jgi:hypothetical protein